MIRIGRLMIFVGFLYLVILMIWITLQYIPAKLDVAFLSLKTTEVELGYYRLAFFAHVYSSIFILILGILQFFNTIRTMYPTPHRNIGKAYIILILMIAAPTGFVMGIHGNGGLYSQISFCIQAILWFIFTWLAYTHIKQGHVARHKSFMVLSYAMTLSAISLRLFKWMIVQTIALPPMDTYKIVVWLGWTFNLLVALCINYKNKQ